MWGNSFGRLRALRGGLELIPGLLLLLVSGALLWWSVPQLQEVLLEQESFVPTTHISAGSDCEFRQESQLELNIDARAPTSFLLAFHEIMPASQSHACEYIYVRFPGHIKFAYADRLSGPAMTVESKENIYESAPGEKPLLGKAFLDSSSDNETKFTIVMKNLPEQVRSGDIYIKGELNAFLSNNSFSDKVLHYWIRLPGSHIRDNCQTETECEDDYITDNPHVGAIHMILARNLEIRSLLVSRSSQALTRQGLTRITTEDLAGSVFVEDKENARLRDVLLLYAGALFAAGITIGTDALLEFIRFVLPFGSE